MRIELDSVRNAVVVPMQDVEEPDARAAFIWILGEHGQGIQVPENFDIPSHSHYSCAHCGIQLSYGFWVSMAKAYRYLSFLTFHHSWYTAAL